MAILCTIELKTEDIKMIKKTLKCSFFLMSKHSIPVTPFRFDKRPDSKAHIEALRLNFLDESHKVKSSTKVKLKIH